MSQRRSYGTLLLVASLVLGVFLLTGSFIWMQDKSNMILAVFVLILYGIGQWMTVVYWQRIQTEWESTGEVLARLQQAVSDIPAALDSNLKSIATRLTEGQAQALSKLQAEVNESAKATLENGSALIGRSLADNLAAPLEAMRSLLAGFGERSAAQSEDLKALAAGAREDARQSLAQGAGLISGTLEKHLRAPLASMESALAAWRDQAAGQGEGFRSLAEGLARGQQEWSAKAGRLAEGLSEEFKALATSTARAGETAQAAWDARAAEAQAAWEAGIRELQSSLLAEVTARMESLHRAQSGTQNQLLERALAGIESQTSQARETAEAQAGAMRAATDGQGRALNEAATAFAEGLRNAREESLRMVGEVQAAVASGQTALVEGVTAAQNRLVEEISALQRQTLGEAARTLEAQGQLGLEVAGRVSELAGQMGQGAKDMSELAHVSTVNQTEMQAGVAMLNAGLASILDRLEKQAEAGDGYQSLLADLGRTLASFQERAGEVLVENAMKTQEILMEVLLRREGAAAPSAEGGAGEASEATLATVS